MKDREDDLEKEWNKLKGKLLLDIVNENSNKDKLEDKKVEIEKNINPWSFGNFVGKLVNVKDSTVLLDNTGNVLEQSNLEQNINPFADFSKNNFETSPKKIINEPKYIESSENKYIEIGESVEPTSLRPVMEDLPKDMIRANFVDPLSSRSEFREFQGKSDFIFESKDVDNKKYMEKDSR